MSARGLDAATVRSVLRVTDVLDRFGEQYRDRPEIRLAHCRACSHHDRRGRASLVVNRASGRWIYYSGVRADGTPCRGDVLELLAAYAGLDTDSRFPEVVELGASIAGIAPN